MSQNVGSGRHDARNVRVTSNLPTLRTTPFSDPKRRLCQKDLARRWGLSTRTLERWRMQGRGPAFMRLGGRVIYRAEDVEAFEIESLHQSTVVGGLKSNAGDAE